MLVNWAYYDDDGEDEIGGSCATKLYSTVDSLLNRRDYFIAKTQ